MFRVNYIQNKTIIETNIIKNENNTHDCTLFKQTTIEIASSTRSLNNNNNTLYYNMLLSAYTILFITLAQYSRVRFSDRELYRFVDSPRKREITVKLY